MPGTCMIGTGCGAACAVVGLPGSRAAVWSHDLFVAWVLRYVAALPLVVGAVYSVGV